MDCAKRGYDLFLTDISKNGLESIATGIKNRYHVRVLTHPCDLTCEKDLYGLFSTLEEQEVRLGMLLNVAGVDFEGSFMERGADAIMKIVQLNVAASLAVTHGALCHREEATPFYLVFVSSLASFYPMPLKATYAASKCFLREFALALGQELRHSGVRVLTLCPGGLMTTDEALSGIAAQGFWGQVTTNPLETVTHRTISRVRRGKTLYIPGAVNAVFRVVGLFLPKTLIAGLLYKRWRAAQAQWLQSEGTVPASAQHTSRKSAST